MLNDQELRGVGFLVITYQQNNAVSTTVNHIKKFYPDVEVFVVDKYDIKSSPQTIVSNLDAIFYAYQTWTHIHQWIVFLDSYVLINFLPVQIFNIDVMPFWTSRIDEFPEHLPLVEAQLTKPFGSFPEQFGSFIGLFRSIYDCTCSINRNVLARLYPFYLALSKPTCMPEVYALDSVFGFLLYFIIGEDRIIDLHPFPMNMYFSKQTGWKSIQIIYDLRRPNYPIDQDDMHAIIFPDDLYFEKLVYTNPNDKYQCMLELFYFTDQLSLDMIKQLVDTKCVKLISQHESLHVVHMSTMTTTDETKPIKHHRTTVKIISGFIIAAGIVAIVCTSRIELAKTPLAKATIAFNVLVMSFAVLMLFIYGVWKEYLQNLETQQDKKINRYFSYFALFVWVIATVNIGLTVEYQKQVDSDKEANDQDKKYAKWSKNLSILIFVLATLISLDFRLPHKIMKWWRKRSAAAQTATTTPI